MGKTLPINEAQREVMIEFHDLAYDQSGNEVCTGLSHEESVEYLDLRERSIRDRDFRFGTDGARLDELRIKISKTRAGTL